MDVTQWQAVIDADLASAAWQFVHAAAEPIQTFFQRTSEPLPCYQGWTVHTSPYTGNQYCAP